MTILTPTDQRVLSFLRQRRAGVASIARECFQIHGATGHPGIRPAGAHLARMTERGLLRRVGSLYEALREETPSLGF